ncbi:MAG TPA: alkyl sulfatase dimerization domain-containing protein, partial [Candidatus Krumholzibacterium sp.]|nr:alkyl sulfatase dimerization domain-containing protein [Candidatus Krumholzibacterium sp.]
YFKSVIEEHPPLRAILLTHAHRDHWDDMDVWTDGLDVPIIAQREFIRYNEYWGRLAPFFARRGAIWGRREIPAPEDVEPLEPVVPTVTFADEYTYEAGGVHFRMVHTPGETPDHTTIWIPELGAVFVGDNYYEWFINNATPRGTLTRPVLGYIAALDLALSYEPDLFLMGHGGALVPKGVVKETITTFRDAIRYIHDETIKGINEGKDVHTLMREVQVPEEYGLRPLFGNVAWTVRGIYHENVGWFDENPSSMYAEPASSIYSELVEITGPDAILDRAEALSKGGEYVKALHLTDVVLGADSSHKRGNQVRLAALRAIKASRYHYIEHIWLDYGIRTCERNLATAED